MPIAASEVAVAERISQLGDEQEQRNDHDPAADPEERAEEAGHEPDQDQPHPPMLERVASARRVARAPRLGARRGGALPRLRRRARADRRPAGRRGPSCPRRARSSNDSPAATRSSRVVSGRAGDDVRARVGVDGVVYVGSHGLELEPEASAGGRGSAAFAADAVAGADTELKGLSVAFHFRTADGRARRRVRALEEIADRARATKGSIARFGRKVLEVLPPLDSNKGTAVRQLLADAGLRRALVAGDDTTDLDAFRAVDGLELRGARRGRRRRVAAAAARGAPTSSSRARRVRRAAAAAVMHVDEAVLAPVRARFGTPVVLPWQRRDQRRRVGGRDAQPGAHARRDALHPRSGAPARAHPQAAVRRGRVATAGRRRHAGRGLRRRRRPRGARGDRAARRAAALPRGDARALHERGAGAAVAHARLPRRDRGRRRSSPAIPARSRTPAGGRSPSSPARYARGCSRPTARSGATASRCTMRRFRPWRRAPPCRRRRSRSSSGPSRTCRSASR